MARKASSHARVLNPQPEVPLSHSGICPTPTSDCLTPFGISVPPLQRRVVRCQSAGDNPCMASLRQREVLMFLLILSLATAPLWAAKDFVMPHAENAASYPSHDAHSNEHVTVAIDLYDSPPKDDVFMTRYLLEGILPVFLVITNDGDKPISVAKLDAQLVTSRRAKLEALAVDDVMRRVAHVNVSSTNPGRVGSIPIPGTAVKTKKAQQQLNEVNHARFNAFAVEPHSTQAGFLFFDIQDVRNPTQGAHIYLTGVRDSSGNELMYFDIPVTPAGAPN